jgi:uncharacterized repeat protein (TIGR02543 family)
MTGLRFVVTGKLERFTRKSIIKIINANNGIVSDDVNAKTDFLIIGEKPGKKLEKAIQLQIPILNESQFMEKYQIKSNDFSLIKGVEEIQNLEVEISLRAQILNRYTITFNCNEGSVVESITQDYGTSVTEPVEPTRKGYRFGGWYVDEGMTTAYTFSTMPSENMTLYAKWELIYTQDYYEYTVTGDKVTIINYIGYEKDIAIPSTLGGYKVTTIGDRVCNFKSLTSITIPHSVTKIGDTAFAYNRLTSLTIPDSVTIIGYHAFDWSEIESLSLGVHSNFVYENNLLMTSDYKTVLGGVGNLTSVTIPDSVTTIGDYAFKSNHLTSVTIPDSVTTIGNWAFSYNRLTSVTIPDSVTIIGYHAFLYNRLTSVTIGNSVTTIGDYAFNKNHLSSATIGNDVTTIGDFAFAGNDLTSITIPDSVTKIGDYTFVGNQLTSLTIPDSVTTIGRYAFNGNQLTSVTIGNSVTIIDAGAFEHNKLTSVTIPDSVTTIGDEAFSNNSITSVTILGEKSRFNSKWKKKGFPNKLKAKNSK